MAASFFVAGKLYWQSSKFYDNFLSYLYNFKQKFFQTEFSALIATSCNQYPCRRLKASELLSLVFVFQEFIVNYSLDGTAVLSIYSQFVRHRYLFQDSQQI